MGTRRFVCLVHFGLLWSSFCQGNGKGVKPYDMSYPTSQSLDYPWESWQFVRFPFLSLHGYAFWLLLLMMISASSP